MRNYGIGHIDDVRNVIEIDGIRINRENGSWILIRPSGTEPKIRVVVRGELKRR